MFIFHTPNGRRQRYGYVKQPNYYKDKCVYVQRNSQKRNLYFATIDVNGR